ncbi:MAG TPA: hypothetical protein PK129_10435 [Cellvibrionaceae bacterium]|nr:hypothetical protein [Cellvibrionaceae bacterium]
MTFFDFNSAEEQSTFDLIPRGTLVPVRMTLKPGGFDEPSQGWTGGYATLGSTGAVYLNCEFVVLDGEFARRKLWSRIGLHSPKGPEWSNKGRTFIKALLNSARGVWPSDTSPAAQEARRIASFAELDGIVFIGRVDWEKNKNGEFDNVIKTAITPDHPDYATRVDALHQARLVRQASATAHTPTATTTTDSSAYAAASGRPVPGHSRPAWAQGGGDTP